MSLGEFKGCDDAGRVAALRRYEILGSEPERELDDIVNLVCSIFHMPYAAVNLIDSDTQWTRAAAGEQGAYLPRSEGFCDQTIRSTEAVGVEDARLDPRFCANPRVTCVNGVRSYLGVPLMTPDGYNIGALCVFGLEPRPFSAADVEVLRSFARVVMSHLELRLIARRDALTGLLTRRAFVERVDRAIASSDTDKPAVLILIDIDHFKTINDRFGHPVGDAVLREVSASMAAELERGDALGRFGGEEFALLVLGPRAEAAVELAERLRRAVAALRLEVLAGASVTISLGLALRMPNETFEGWLGRADAALYEAKHAGRDQVKAAA